MTPGSAEADSDRSAALARRLRLIVITDATLAAPRPVKDVVADALRAGAPAVQLRDKRAGARKLLETGRVLRALTHETGALLFVNDRLDVALALGADGVHLGPNDIPVAAAHRVAPDGFLIGYSADDPDEARRAVEDGASYIGCGTIYPTSSKADAGSPIGPHALRRVVQRALAPVVGIGGIDAASVPEVAATGAAGAAVLGAVMGADDVEATVRALLEPWDRGTSS